MAALVASVTPSFFPSFLRCTRSLPTDFSKLGGGAGGGMPDLGDDADEDDDAEDGDDAEMPGLEGDDEAEDEGKGKGKADAPAEEKTGGAKIQEVP